MSLRHKAPHAIRPAPRKGKQLDTVLVAGLERLEVAAAPTAARPDKTGLEPPQQRPAAGRERQGGSEARQGRREAVNTDSKAKKKTITRQMTRRRSYAR